MNTGKKARPLLPEQDDGDDAPESVAGSGEEQEKGKAQDKAQS